MSINGHKTKVLFTIATIAISGCVAPPTPRPYSLGVIETRFTGTGGSIAVFPFPDDVQAVLRAVDIPTTAVPITVAKTDWEQWQDIHSTYWPLHSTLDKAKAADAPVRLVCMGPATRKQVEQCALDQFSLRLDILPHSDHYLNLSSIRSSFAAAGLSIISEEVVRWPYLPARGGTLLQYNKPGYGTGVALVLEPVNNLAVMWMTSPRRPPSAGKVDMATYQPIRRWLRDPQFFE